MNSRIKTKNIIFEHNFVCVKNLIIADKKLPEQAKVNLKQFGLVIEFSTHSITYEAISGHPDIFICQLPDKLILAPNLPSEFFKIFKDEKIHFHKGIQNVGLKYPESAVYNTVVTGNYFIFKKNIPDTEIIQNLSSQKFILVSQGYCRCNLLPLKDDSFITSDKNIYQNLMKEKLNVLYVDPKQIILPGFKHGFFGGTAGVIENNVLISGSLKYFSDRERVKSFLQNLNYSIIELYDGPLFDGGSIFCLKLKFE